MMAERLGRRLRRSGLANFLIAATAIAHDFMVLPGNGKRFDGLGIAFADLGAGDGDG